MEGLTGTSCPMPASLIVLGVKGNQQGTMSTVRLGGVEGQRDFLRLVILPIESAIQHVQTEVAVDDEIFRRRLVGRQPAQTGSLLPDQARLVHFVLSYQVADIEEDQGLGSGWCSCANWVQTLAAAAVSFWETRKSKNAGVDIRGDDVVQQERRYQA